MIRCYNCNELDEWVVDTTILEVSVNIQFILECPNCSARLIRVVSLHSFQALSVPQKELLRPNTTTHTS